LQDERATFMQLQAAYLLQSADINLGWFQAVLPDLPWEPWVRRRWIKRVRAYVKLVKELTACLKGMHTATADYDLQHSAHNPMVRRPLMWRTMLWQCTLETYSQRCRVLFTSR
jgi:hypothetical protein